MFVRHLYTNINISSYELMESPSNLRESFISDDVSLPLADGLSPREQFMAVMYSRVSH